MNMVYYDGKEITILEVTDNIVTFECDGIRYELTIKEFDKQFRSICG